MRDIWGKLFGSAQGDSLWGQIRPWVIAALAASVASILWALVFGIVPPSLDSREQTDYLLAEVLNLRIVGAIVFLVVGSLDEGGQAIVCSE